MHEPLNFASQEDAYRKGYGLGAKTVDGFYSFMYWNKDDLGEVFLFHPKQLRVSPTYRIPVHPSSLGYDAIRIEDLRKINV